MLQVKRLCVSSSHTVLEFSCLFCHLLLYIFSEMYVCYMFQTTAVIKTLNWDKRLDYFRVL